MPDDVATMRALPEAPTLAELVAALVALPGLEADLDRCVVARRRRAVTPRGQRVAREDHA